jgi:hypothetical protein
MNDYCQRVAVHALAIAVASMLGISGCGSSHPMAQVRGKVVFADGKMPPAGIRMVRFECAADSNAALRKGATGAVNDDGTFELYTKRPGDGVHLGRYDVTFAFCRSATDQRPMIPAVYTKSATTPFHVVVDGDKDDFEFRIDSGAAKPIAN